ncbi:MULTISPECIES: hypothetical protein [unclassified Nocardiopsis]|uniref:hypothetical protein n=1 Tax=unclassified Nocardiopsis TaxID=2649073 RepID=UPI00135847F3|nr:MULTISPECIES: hypothetical protein [unclassified Nocardiopsis]
MSGGRQKAGGRSSWGDRRAGGADVALHRHPGDLWQAGPLPTLQDHGDDLV